MPLDFVLEWTEGYAHIKGNVNDADVGNFVMSIPAIHRSLHQS